MGDTWHVDELFITLQGQRHYLWQAVDEDGDLLDILVQSRRNRRAAVRFFRQLLKRQGCVPRRLITDKRRSYPAAHRTVMPSVVHRTDEYLNNRAEVSHQPTRQRERQMRHGSSQRPSCNGSRRYTVWCRISSALAATYSSRPITVCCERGRSSNGRR